MKRAFTLVELVVVIAIIGIISMVVLASMQEAHVREEAQSVIAATIPEPTAYAVDVTGTLTPEQVALLNEKLEATNDETREIGVLLVASTKPYDITQYGIMVGDKWKVGSAEQDNGVIIIIAVEDRQVRIEVGSGAEAYITDGEAGAILDNVMLPYLKEGNWYGAINAGIEAIKGEFPN